MKKIGKMLAAIALTGLLFSTFVTQAGAQSATPSPTPICTTGAYGSTNCYTPNQTPVPTYTTNQVDERPVQVTPVPVIHKTVQAGVEDTVLFIMAATLMAAFILSAAGYKKSLQ